MLSSSIVGVSVRAERNSESFVLFESGFLKGTS